MVETLISSLKPIGNIVLICCAFFVIFGILGVQVRGTQAGQGMGGGSAVGEEAPHSCSVLQALCQAALVEQPWSLPAVSSHSREGDRHGPNG